MGFKMKDIFMLESNYNPDKIYLKYAIIHKNIQRTLLRKKLFREDVIDSIISDSKRDMQFISVKGCFKELGLEDYVKWNKEEVFIPKDIINIAKQEFNELEMKALDSYLRAYKNPKIPLSYKLKNTLNKFLDYFNGLANFENGFFEFEEDIYDSYRNRLSENYGLVRSILKENKGNFFAVIINNYYLSLIHGIGNKIELSFKSLSFKEKIRFFFPFYLHKMKEKMVEYKLSF